MGGQMPFESSKDLVDAYDRMFRSITFYLGDDVEAGIGNVGLFLPGTVTHAAAGANLMEHLLGLIRRHDGLILDVGCGTGGSTRHVTRYYRPACLYGANVSQYQVKECRRRLPQSHFGVMAAEHLAFRSESFDAVISVEAALHFRGRREFLREACRVLKPAGELVVADVLFGSEPQVFRRMLAGQELYQDLGEYKALWSAAGFSDVSLEDLTGPCWRSFAQHAKKRIVRDLITKKIDGATFRQLIGAVRDFEELPVTAYVLAHGCKR